MLTQYLSLGQVLAIHDTLIEKFGGIFGLRDQGLLESAIFQPQQSFGTEELYPSIFDKASAYAFFISENQPFLDGNKRTAVTTAGVFLEINGFELDASEEELYDTIMEVANKKLSREELAEWFRKQCRAKKRKKQ